MQSIYTFAKIFADRITEKAFVLRVGLRWVQIS